MNISAKTGFAVSDIKRVRARTIYLPISDLMPLKKTASFFPVFSSEKLFAFLMFTISITSMKQISEKGFAAICVGL